MEESNSLGNPYNVLNQVDAEEFPPVGTAITKQQQKQIIANNLSQPTPSPLPEPIEDNTLDQPSKEEIKKILSCTSACKWVAGTNGKFGTCYRPNCNFAHSMQSFKPPPCRYEDDCRFIHGVKDNKGILIKESKCTRFHPCDKTITNWLKRSSVTPPNLPPTEEESRKPTPPKTTPTPPQPSTPINTPLQLPSTPPPQIDRPLPPTPPQINRPLPPTPPQQSTPPPINRSLPPTPPQQFTPPPINRPLPPTPPQNENPEKTIRLIVGIPELGEVFIEEMIANGLYNFHIIDRSSTSVPPHLGDIAILPSKELAILVIKGAVKKILQTNTLDLEIIVSSLSFDIDRLLL